MSNVLSFKISSSGETLDDGEVNDWVTVVDTGGAGETGDGVLLNELSLRWFVNNFEIVPIRSIRLII